MTHASRRSQIVATLAVALAVLGTVVCSASAAPGVLTQDQIAVPGGPDPLPSTPDPVPSRPRPRQPSPPSRPSTPSTPSTPSRGGNTNTTPDTTQLSDAERAALERAAAAKVAAARRAAAKAALAARIRAQKIKRQKRIAALRRQRIAAIEKAFGQVGEADAAATKAVTRGVGVTGIVVTNAAGGLGDGGSGAVNNTVLVLLVMLAIGSALLAKLPDLSVASHVAVRAEGMLQIGRTRRPELIALSVGSLLLALLLIGLS